MARKSELPASFYKEDFISLYKKESSPQVKSRYLGCSHIQNGKTTQEVADLLHVKYRTVDYWIKRYKDCGIAGLRDQKGRGLKPRLDKKYEDIFCEKVLNLQSTRKGGRIRGEDIIKLLKIEFQVEYKLSGVYNLLHRVGLSWISSRSRHPNQLPEVQEAFKKLREHCCRCHECGCLL